MPVMTAEQVRAALDAALRGLRDTWRGRVAADLSQFESALDNARQLAARLSGMAADWTHVDSAEPSHNKRNESFGTEYFVHPSQPGERTAFYGRRLGGKAKWYRHGAPVTGVTHYMPLPAAPEPPHV